MKNKTKLDINIQKDLIKITTKKLKFSTLIIGILLILIGLYINKSNDVIGMGLAFGGLAIIIIFGMFWDKIMISLFKNNLLKGDVYNYYEFKEDGFNIHTIRNEDNIGQSNLKYSDLIKIVEYEKYIVLFISNAQAFVLSKKDMFEGSVEDLVSLIKTKVTKYKIIK